MTDPVLTALRGPIWADLVVLMLMVVLGGLVSALPLLMARDKLRERRRAHRQRRLATSCMRLSQLRDHDAIIERLVEEARRFLDADDVRFQSYHHHVPAAGLLDLRELTEAVGREDGSPLGWLCVRLPRRKRLEDDTVLAQLCESATVAFETIALLSANAQALRDATASRREAEAAQAHMERILSAMSDAMLALDPDLRVAYLNPNAASLLGRDRDDVLGRKLSALLPQETAMQFEAELRTVIAWRRNASFRARWPKEQGTQASLMVRAFLGADGITLYMQDITVQAEAEEQLHQAAKMDALGQLTGGIAHDFNNLLTVILGNLELLAEQPQSDPENVESLELATRAGRSAANLTSRLLAFARRQPLLTADVDAASLTTQMAGLLRRTLGAGIRVSVDAAPKLWAVRTDATQFENALINLALNARDAMHGSGDLRITLANHVVEPGPVLGVLSPGDYVCIEVIDTGEGIEPEMLSKVFDPFISTKPVGMGTGLGLPMVYGFARQSGGSVAIRSEVGRGTVVQLILPRGRAVPRPEIVASLGAAPAGRGEKILLVEDAPLVRRYVKVVLQRLKYSVTDAGDAEEVFRLLSAGFTPDLLLSDIMLPNGVDGIEMYRRLRATWPSLPVVLMSGYADQDTLTDHLPTQSPPLLRKPLQRDELAQAVRDALCPKNKVHIES